MCKYKVVGVAFLAVLIFLGAARAVAGDPPGVRALAGRHQQAGNAEVSGEFSATLFADGSFRASFSLNSLDCDFINFRAHHATTSTQWLSVDVMRPVVATFETAGTFSLGATTLVMDAPLWVRPSDGAVEDQGLFRRCSVDDMVVAFRLTIRSMNFAPLGRYDGDISATLLSGAVMQQSFSGTFSSVSAMPFLPIIGFGVEPGRLAAGECLNLRWQALTGAARYALEYAGPYRQFTGRVFSASPEPRGDRWGAVVLSSATAATVCTSPHTPRGVYELRVFGLNPALNVAPGTGSSIPVAVTVEPPR